MHILVTGASGFIGRSLTHALAAAGHTGIAVARAKVLDLPQGWVWVERSRAIGGTTDGGVPDVVVHLEVKHHVLRPSANDLALFEDVNVLGTRQWLDWCTRQGVQYFVYFSSIKAVANSMECQTEQAAGWPEDAYGRSKREAEELVRSWAVLECGRSARILRPAVVYGRGCQGNILAMTEAIAAGRFRLIDSGKTIKSLVSLGNLLAAVLFLMAHEPAGCQIFNIVDRESYTVRQLSRMLALELGVSDQPLPIPLLAARLAARCGDLVIRAGGRFPLNSSRLNALIQNTYFSCERLQKMGFVHPQSTVEGLREMVNWYRTKPS